MYWDALKYQKFKVECLKTCASFILDDLVTFYRKQIRNNFDGFPRHAFFYFLDLARQSHWGTGLRLNDGEDILKYLIRTDLNWGLQYYLSGQIFCAISRRTIIIYKIRTIYVTEFLQWNEWVICKWHWKANWIFWQVQMTQSCISFKQGHRWTFCALQWWAGELLRWQPWQRWIPTDI